MPVPPDLAAEYRAAFARYMAGTGEEALERAYALGRGAVSEGVGVLDLAALHNEVLAERVRSATDAANCAAIIERGARFLLEALSPFEMTHRGFREANTALRQLTESLEQRVAERTAELEAARVRAERANRAKSEFLAVISHELRTPLNAVIGYVDLLEAGVGGPLTEAQQARLGRIRASALQLLDLIEQILTFVQAEAGREEVRLETVDLDSLAQDAAAPLRPVAEERGLAFEVRPPRSPVRVRTDPAKVRQILRNLLSNALKFTEEGGIVVEAEREDDWMRFRVQDTGIGIEPEDLKRVFEPFWQAEASTTRRHGGAGLGLSVARRLARLLGGDITVESEPGTGTTFIVRLPAN
ncbi:MAG TPA: ATP-binding protein [Longimicrobiales bacterium]